MKRMVLSTQLNPEPGKPSKAGLAQILRGIEAPAEPRLEFGDLAFIDQSRRERVADMQPNRVGRIGLQCRNAEWGMYSRKGAGALVLLVLGLTLGAGLMPVQVKAQSAGTWSKRGDTAEAREDFDAAFEAYRQAHLKKPKDIRYKTRYERMKFEAANMHVDRGRVLRTSGDITGAINEFARAVQIDPGNEAAAQELQLSEKQRPATAGPDGAAVQPAGSNAGTPLIPGVAEQTPYQRKVQADIDSMAGPVVLKPVSTDAITLHMQQDAKVVYQAVGKAAGLNVIFDPDYQSKQIPVDLTGVSLQDALRIVGTLSGTFYKPVTANTIFVAQNNRTKHTDLDDLAAQTFYLTNVSAQNDANEILVALRNLLDPSVKLYLVASQNAIIVRATPAELTLAEKLVNDLDRVRPEVVMDVAVLEVSRQLERNLGITLPTSFGLTPQATNLNVSNASSNTSSNTTNNGATNSSTNANTGVTLNTLAHLNATNFAVSITGGTLNALLSDSDTRVLQNPRLRATDGQRSTLKIGSKIPVATGSYSAGAAVTTAALGVQTQFTYLDVGVNIDITPTVHYDHEISLKMKIEVSSQNGQVTISGVTEPIIAQKVSDQVIQLKDGEPAILAGLVQKQDSVAISGTPGLGELPILKYFFASHDKTVQTDELVFLVIPHIVRESILTDENTRQIYTGTGQAVELRYKDPAKETAVSETPAAVTPAGPTTSAANAANAMIGKIAADAKPMPVPGVTGGTSASGAVAAANAQLAPVKLSVMPPASNQSVGSTFQVAITAANAHDLTSVPMQLQFDPKVISLVNVDDNGTAGLLGNDGQAVTTVHRDDGNGAVTVSETRPPGSKGVNGQGTICTLTFKAIAPGVSPVSLVRVGAKDSAQNTLPAVGSQGVVTVK